MSTLETIQRKIVHLPPEAQEEVLEAVERIEELYTSKHPQIDLDSLRNTHPLSLIADMATDVGVVDLADRHDHYAHGKVEE